MLPRAKCRARVKLHDKFPRLGFVFFPRRLDDGARADLFRMEELLPRLGPILVGDRLPRDRARALVDAVLRERRQSLAEILQLSLKILVQSPVRLDTHDLRFLALLEIRIVPESRTNVFVQERRIFDDHARSAQFLQDFRHKIRRLVRRIHAHFRPLQKASLLSHSLPSYNNKPLRARKSPRPKAREAHKVQKSAVCTRIYSPNAASRVSLPLYMR